MIKYENKKGVTSIECGGPLHEIGADILTLVHIVYDSIGEQNEKAAETFKNMMTEHISLAFKPEDEMSAAIEKLKEERKQCEDAKSDLADALKGLIDELFN